MYDVADDNLPNDEFEDDSDEECQILGEKWVNPPPSEVRSLSPVIDSLIRASVISGAVSLKRPATDSQRNPREATRFKHAALQVTDDELEWPTSESSPVPTTSQNLVQTSISISGHLSVHGQSNQPSPQVPGCSRYQSRSCSMIQPIRNCMSVPFTGPQCAHSSSSVQSCHFPMCGCNSLARPIPMRPSGIISSHYSPQPSCTSGELSVSNGLDTNAAQPSLPLQQNHDCSTLSSHSLNQPFQSCLSSPFIRTQCAHSSTQQSSHLIASSSCTIPVDSSPPPQTTHPQEAVEQPQTSSQPNNILSITQASHENSSVTADNRPIYSGQAALDLSSPLQGQSSRNPAFVNEKRPIWQGRLHYEEKALNLSDPNVSHYLSCTFSTLLNTNGDSHLDVNLWPSQMALSLIASEILKEKNMLEVLKSAAHHVVINFHEESQVLKRIKRNMNHGWMGCVQFITPNDVRIMIVLYMPQKKVYVGFIPHEQKVFFNTFRHVYEKKRRLRNLQKQIEAGIYLAGSQPTSSSASTSMGQSEQSRNQFEEIDNEIDAHILALHRRHQEAQPSTSYQQPCTSHSASDQSIEARLKRLEAAQKGNTRNVNEYEEIDNEINAHIAAHWLRHFSQETSASTSQQTQVSPPLPSVPYSSSTSNHFFDEGLKRLEIAHQTLWQVPPILPTSTFKPYYYLERFAGTVSGGGTRTANVITQSSQETPPSVDENSVESQASEIFGNDLVQKVVQKKLTETGKRFYTVEELCDEILKYEESKPKPVEERAKKEVSEELLCKICLDERLSIVFEPCGHLATCQECAQPLTKCPMCRTMVRKKMRIYM